MNLDELRSVQEKERRKDSLQHLRDSFYDDVATYIAELRAARDRRADEVENPFSDETVRRMSDEIETAEEVAEALYERRVGKVVKLASFAAAGMPAEEDGMTSQERTLYDDLVERIEANKSVVLDAIAGTSTRGDRHDDRTVDRSEEFGPNSGGPPSADSSPGEETDLDARQSPGGDTDATAEALDTDATAETPEPDDTDETPTTDDTDMLADAMGDVGDDTDSPNAVEEVAPEPAPPDVVDADQPGGDSDSDVSRDSDGSDSVAAHHGNGESDRIGKSDEIGESDDTGESDKTGESDRTGESHAPDHGGSADPSGDGGLVRTTVRITEDVGAIFGVDEREYDLEADDVVTLPETNATPLIEQGAAEKLE